MNTPTSTLARTTGLRRGSAVVAVVVIALALLSGCGSSGGSSATKSSTKSGLDPATTVTTKLLSFMPQTLTVKAGTKVTWTAGDGIAHTVTTGTFTLGSDQLRTSEHPDGLINMPLAKGKDVSYTFAKPGKYVYYCSIHKGMNGEIVVTK